ncbi:hypothetical protein [Amycolatopsis nigrescens]|nr:hypothetical protein [Amycolatopsis nigrescens]
MRSRINRLVRGLTVSLMMIGAVTVAKPVAAGADEACGPSMAAFPR